MDCFASLAMTAKRSLAERVLPAAAGRGAGRVGGLEIVQQDFPVLWLGRRHVVAADHQVDGVVPSGAGQSLRRDQLEVVTGGARIKSLVAAGAGLNVILVDADLRRGWVSPRLGLHPEAGLGALLAGERSFDESLVDYPIEAAPGGRLTVVPAGHPPHNPAALISSDVMRRVLAQAESRSDLVIVDTPAALAVSDPLPLMSAVSGVVLVARMNRSSRMTVRRLQRMIEAAGGTAVGVVATGVTAAGGAAVGPVQNHGRSPYNHRPGRVKSAQPGKLGR